MLAFSIPYKLACDTIQRCCCKEVGGGWEEEGGRVVVGSLQGGELERNFRWFRWRKLVEPLNGIR